jgi:Tol biopolymer transport system component
MPLPNGERLGTYEIVALIGKGGMGEVYRARDTRLKREVAIKVLPNAFARDPDRLHRFKREAEVLASLNHPNIAAIYGVEESNGLYALVMELVEGETLSSPLAVDTALGYAKQIADALEYAHEKGVMHRDLKPANIKVTPEGRVKLLDFGLAKAIEDPAAQTGDPSHSPTLTLGATQGGAIMGTAAYMPPEQATGKPADRRADIWSFGAVLYEMLTGKRAFAGESVTEILGAVLHVEPDWNALPQQTPVSVTRLIQRCLKKDRKQRLQAIGDARITIEEVLSGDIASSTITGSITQSNIPQPASPAAAAPRSRFRVIGGIAAGVLVLVAVGVVYFRDTPPAAIAEPIRLSFSIPQEASFPAAAGAIAVSPDGRRILFTAAGSDGVRRIYARSLETQESRVLIGTEGVVGVPFWSSDSKTIGFGDGMKLKKIDAAGGPPQVVCDSPGLVGGGYFTADGRTMIFGTAGAPGAGDGGIYQVPSGGGTRSALTRLDRAVKKEGFHSHPSPLPNGKHFVYVRAATGDEGGIYAGSIDATPEQQESQRLLGDQASPVYVPGANGARGYLVFRRDGTLLAQPFDPGSRKLTGDPSPIAEQIATMGRFGVFAVSTNGVMAYRTSASLTTQIVWVDRQGAVKGVVDSTTSPSMYSQVAISPEGNRVVATRAADQGNPFSLDLWMIDLTRSGSSRFTFDPARDNFAVWSPDGRRVVFTSSRSGLSDMYMKSSDGTGAEELLLKSGAAKSPSSWSRDGRYLLYSVEDPKTKDDLWALPLTPEGSTNGEPIPVVQGPFNENQGRISPDGRWVAYTSDESGRPEVFVQPFHPSSHDGGRWMVSSGGGFQPRWSRDGKELFYLSDNQAVMAVTISGGTAFEATVPKKLFDSRVLLDVRYAVQTGWDISPDGRFLMIVNPPGDAVSSSINVVLNWPGLLKR